MGDGGTLNRLDPCARIPCTCPTRLSYRLPPLAGARAKGGLSAARLPGTGGCLRYCVTATLRARRGRDFIGRNTDTAPEPPILAIGNGTLEMTLPAAADPPLRNGISANRGVAMRGSRAEAGSPVRAAQPLRPSSPPHIIMVPSQWVGRRPIEAAPDRRAEAGSSSADPVPPDCSVAVPERDRNGVDAAHSRPAALSPRPALRRAACCPRSCQAARSGSCRTPGTAAASLRTEPRTARRDSSPPQPSCAPSHARTASGPAKAASGHTAASDCG